MSLSNAYPTFIQSSLTFIQPLFNHHPHHKKMPGQLQDVENFESNCETDLFLEKWEEELPSMPKHQWSSFIRTCVKKMKHQEATKFAYFETKFKKQIEERNAKLNSLSLINYGSCSRNLGKCIQCSFHHPPTKTRACYTVRTERHEGNTEKDRECVNNRNTWLYNYSQMIGQINDSASIKKSVPLQWLCLFIWR